MDVIVTLKINNERGELLHTVKAGFSDDMGFSLDGLIEHYGEHIEEYLLNKVKCNVNDCGNVIMRYHYLKLSDKTDKHKPNENGNSGIISAYEDGTIMHDMSLTNERIIICPGNIRQVKQRNKRTNN